MPDVLPRLAGISKIIVTSEDEVPWCCQACRFGDQDFFREWFCVNGRKIDLPRVKPDWCPIMVQGSTEELLFTFRNMSEKEKKRVAERKKLRRHNDKNKN
jgi:hypothetical protein